MDLIASTCFIYTIHCSNCNNMFTSNNVYLKTNHTDINADEIKYLRIVKKYPKYYKRYNKLSYLPEKEDRLCEREMSMFHNDKQYYMRVKPRIYEMRIVTRLLGISTRNFTNLKSRYAYF